MILRLALAYARSRPLSTLLVVVLLAVGVGVVTLTLIVTSELEARLTRDARGIDLVIGAKGSPLQIVLAGVYHADVPPGNIPLSALAELRRNPLIGEAIPLALGDSFRGHRIVGTEHSLVTHYGATLAGGSLWTKPMEAVLGSDVARKRGLALGSRFTGSHGLAEGGGGHGDAPYTVVGVLAPTGTVLDRLVLTSIESVWEIHDVHHGVAGPDVDLDQGSGTGSATRTAPAVGAKASAPREVTLVLVKYSSPLAAASLPREINQSTALVAAAPAYETARLFSVFGVGVDLLRAFALLLVAASALMLFVALAQALEERRYDLGIMRALGARPWQVAAVLLVESLVLAAIGTALGLFAGHAVASQVGQVLAAAAPLAADAWRWRSEEGWIVALALGAGILAALLPAWRAARTDVAATLADR